MPSQQPQFFPRRITTVRLVAASAIASVLAAADKLPERRGAGPLLFAAAALIFGAYAITLGADANWDLHNYHLYNAYALLTGRLLTDVAPAGFQSFFHPIADVPFYWLVTHFPDRPRAIAAVMALPHAASAALLFLIARRLLPPGVAGRSVGIAAILAIGLTGAALLTTVGGTMNDYQVAPLMLAGILAALAAVRPSAYSRPPRLGYALTAGLLFGAAAGLKLTTAPYGAAMAATLLCLGLPWGPALRALAVYLAGAAIAFAVLAGPWLLFLWLNFDSPLFPQFNHVLKSPLAPFMAFRDARWYPVTLAEWVAFPLFWAFGESKRISEWAITDPRLAAAFAALIGAALVLAWTARRRSKIILLPTGASETRQAWRLILTFFAAGFVAWLLFFAYLRYLGPIELLAPLPIVGFFFLAARLFPAARRGVLAAGFSALSAATLLFATHWPPWERLPFAERYFSLSVPPMAPASLVLLVGKPLAYVAPFMPRDARFVSINNEMVQPGDTHRLAQRAKDIIAAHAGPIYLVEFERNVARSDKSLAPHRLERVMESCRRIEDGGTHGAKRLCRVRRAGRP